MSTKPAPAEPLEKTAPAAQALRWFLIGFGLVGLTVGYLAGSSRSPVIGTLLPLLFGLIGGAGGLYLGSVDFSSPQTPARLRLLGIALTVFVLPLLFGSAYGELLRTGLGIPNFFPKFLFVGRKAVRLPSLDEKDPAEAVELAVMRSRLTALGTSEQEQAIILERLAKFQDQQSVHAGVISLEQLAKFAAQAQAALQEVPRDNDEKTNEGLESLLDLLPIYSRDFKQLAKQIKAGEPLPLGFVVVAIEHFKDELGRYGIGNSTASSQLGQYLLKQDKARQALNILSYAASSEYTRLYAQARESQRAQVAKEADDFLKVFYGSGTKDTDSIPWKQDFLHLHLQMPTPPIRP
jgi:hypothetical protein